MQNSPMIVPQMDSPNLVKFQELFFPDKQIQKVSYRPKNKMNRNDCYENVKKYILTSGGDIALGWCIWEWPNVMVEAFHHAVWVRPDDKRLIDISPDDTDRFQYHLFVSDPHASFDDNMERYENKRMAINDDPLIFEFFRVTVEFNSAVSKIEPGKFRTVELPPELALLDKNRTELMQKLREKYR